MDNYTEMDHIKREEEQAVAENEVAESTSQATVYRDIPSAPYINTPQQNPVRNQENTRMKIKPRSYSGETIWRDYQSHFDKVCVINEWNTNKLQYLWVHLDGVALSFVEGLPTASTRSYEVLCEALATRFGADRFAAVFKAELQQRKQIKGESLSALGQEMRRLVQRAYPTFTEAAMEEIAVEKFINALGDAAMRLSVHQSHPTRLEQAVEHAMQLDAWSQAEQKRGAADRDHIRSTPTTDEITLNEIMEEIRLLKNKRREDSNQQAQTKLCYACGKPGHFARDCYKKKSQPSGNGAQLH